MASSIALLAAAGSDPGTWPFAILLICVALIVVLITVFKVHAFLALILAAMTAGMLTPAGTLPGGEGKNHFIHAVELTTAELGTTAGKIAVVIGLAAIIGMCLMQSGAADKVVRRFLAAFGERRSGIAILVASYVLSMPIFFDTFFMLLLPIARALALRTGRNYVLYILAICSGGVITHGLVAPHPGPLAMAEILKVDIGQSIIAALLIGSIPLALSWPLIRRLNAKYEMAVPDAKDAVIMDRPESELPPFFLSILPVVLPILLISAASTVVAFPRFQAANPGLASAIEFAGNRNVALLIGAAFAIYLVMRQAKLSFAKINELIGPPFETAGVIILITSAGGAFGLMLRNAGVGEAIRAAAEGKEMNFILLAWAVSAVIRIAQGSATVALLTTAAMVQPMLADAALPYHPIYIFCAIGFGGMMLSWMNDSGFWVIGRLSGFTERQTLRTWTVLLSFNSVVGLLATLLLSKILPLR